TRNRIVGVWNGVLATTRAGAQRVGGQIVFVDTPGIHDGGRSALNKFMNDEALAALESVDAILLVVEADAEGGGAGLPTSARPPGAEGRVLEACREAGHPIVLAVNKVDRVRDKRRLLPLLEGWNARGEFAALVPVSATRGVGVVDVVRELLRLVPEGP